MTISLHVVTWDSASVIAALLDSIKRQTRQPDEIIIVDNASRDNSVNLIRQSGLNVRLIEESTNTGFTGGHNTAFRASTSDIKIVCNPDVVLDPDTIEAIESAWTERPSAGMIIGEMRKNDNTVDSLGISMMRGFRFYNIDEDKPRTEQMPHEVWGATGGFLTISRTTINKILDNECVFDERMIAYKEDVDLSWRIQHAGLTTWLDPKIKVIHPRKIRRKSTKLIWLSSLLSHLSHSKLIRFYSYRNHLWTILKNARAHELILHFPWLLMYEGQKTLYLLFTSPLTLIRAWAQTVRELPRLIQFRRRHL